MAAAIAMPGGASLAAAPASQYASTRYPIVLVHGRSGAGKMGGVVDYWYGMPQLLRAHGARVYVATLSAYESDEQRALQLASFVRGIKLATGADKVNLIGHSQGGTTSRVFAAMAPQDVASITTIGSPHRGIEGQESLRQAGSRLAHVPVLGPLLIGVVTVFYEALGTIQGVSNGRVLPQDWQANVRSLSTSGAAAQNARLDAALKPGTPSALGPDCRTEGATTEMREGVDANGNKTTYVHAAYSWTGRGGRFSLLRSNLLDPSTYKFAISARRLEQQGVGPNDGLVSVCSSKWGKVLSTSYYWNHFDEVNQILGMHQDVDPRTVLLNHANRLRRDNL
ncbi:MULTISPECIES: esterase/lipase family protein [unclassified Cupriavidus]|uniref:esterase/lipase family protein n=1 Tax=Cupriavidus sp. H19C3 TaxID=3241603 RepID=UPI003BF7DDDE